MMGRLRSTVQTLGTTAALISALALAAPSTSHAAASDLSGTDYVSQQPCNDACKAYMAWSDRVLAMFHPSPSVAQIVARPGKPAGRIVRDRTPRTRQSGLGLNSFAQFPVRNDVTPQSAEPSPAEVAPSRSADRIAERFPAAAGFVNAILASTASATNDAPERAVVSATDPISATQATSTIADTAGGRDMRFALLLVLCSLSALVVRGWFRGRTRIARATR